MNINKADILNPESENAAVKLALAETHVISETKAYLESQGVVLDSFLATRRSDTTILIKNIPYGTTIHAIREMFEPHGELTRVLVPPAGTMAVVEFQHPDEASKAFRAVAYRRLGNSIVYLEKGPSGMFKETAPTTITSGVRPVTISDKDAGILDEGPTSVAGGTTLFVKNLAFSTTSERLAQVFKSLPAFAFARVQMKHDPKRPDAKLSMGYGFVGFKDAEAAKKGLKAMEGYILDGHALHVKPAGRGVEDESKGKVLASKSMSTKMIVKNIPFEATKKDIQELFGCVLAKCLVLHSNYRPIGLMVTSSRFGYQRNSITSRGDSRSWTLFHGTKRKMHTARCSIRIYSVDISCYSGRTRATRILICFDRKLGLGSEVVLNCLERSGSWTWVETTMLSGKTRNDSLRSYFWFQNQTDASGFAWLKRSKFASLCVVIPVLAQCLQRLVKRLRPSRTWCTSTRP